MDAFLSLRGRATTCSCPRSRRKNSLLGPLEGTSQEHRVGASIFRNAKYVFQMKQMMRCRDSRLVRIFLTMRTVGGKALSDSDWSALTATEANRSGGSVAQPHAPTDWYHTCYVWSVIAMAAYVESRESARRAGATLFYVQAVDGRGRRLLGHQCLECPRVV